MVSDSLGPGAVAAGGMMPVRRPTNDDEDAPAVRWALLCGSPAPEGWPQLPREWTVADVLALWAVHAEELSLYWHASEAERTWRGQFDFGDGWPIPRVAGRPCFAEQLAAGVAWEDAQRDLHAQMGWAWTTAEGGAI